MVVLLQVIIRVSRDLLQGSRGDGVIDDVDDDDQQAAGKCKFLFFKIFFLLVSYPLLGTLSLPRLCLPSL